MSEKLAGELATEAAVSVITKGVREEILNDILNIIKSNMVEVTIPILLRYASKQVQERDGIWVRELASLYAKSSRVPANPTEVEEAIRKLQSVRENDIKRASYREGYEDGFKAALERGARLAWGAAQHEGKSLDEVLKALEAIRP